MAKQANTKNEKNKKLEEQQTAKKAGKYVFNAPLHISKINVSKTIKELKTKYGKKSYCRKDDGVKLMSGVQGKQEK